MAVIVLPQHTSSPPFVLEKFVLLQVKMFTAFIAAL